MVKITDVAKYAGVSVSTVSRVLSKDETFSATQSTIDKVNEAVESLGYKKLRVRKVESKRPAIAILMMMSSEDEELDPYWHEIRVNIEKEAKRKGFNVDQVVRANQLAQSNLTLDENRSYIVLGSVFPETLRLNGLLPNRTVIVDNSSVDTDGYDRVSSDLYEATLRNLSILKEAGHTKIAFVGGVNNVKNLLTSEYERCEDIRFKTYDEFTKLNGLNNPNFVKIGDWSSKEGYRLVNELMRQDDKPSAVIMGSDPMSIGAIHALSEMGLRVPDDVSIISFDNVEMSEFTNPPLTTTDLNNIELGKQAVTLLIQRLEGRQCPIKVVVQSEVILRSSVKNIKREEKEIHIKT